MEFSEVEREIEIILKETIEFIGEKCVYHVSKHLEAGEYGVALDELGDWLLNFDISIPEISIFRMRRVYRAMNAEERNIETLLNEYSLG